MLTDKGLEKHGKFGRQIIVIVVVIAIVVIALRIFHDHHHTNLSKDVNITACHHGNQDGDFGTTALVTVFNSGSHPATYFFTAVFVENGETVDRIQEQTPLMNPGESSTETATSGHINPGIECSVTGVHRL